MGFRVWGLGFRDTITPFIKNQMEKNMENEMETEVCRAGLWVSQNESPLLVPLNVPKY